MAWTACCACIRHSSRSAARPTVCSGPLHAWPICAVVTSSKRVLVTWCLNSFDVLQGGTNQTRPNKTKQESFSSPCAPAIRSSESLHRSDCPREPRSHLKSLPRALQLCGDREREVQTVNMHVLSSDTWWSGDIRGTSPGFLRVYESWGMYFGNVHGPELSVVIPVPPSDDNI